MKIAVIGAGITGLTAAYRLSQKNHQVVVFEREKFPGGLAAGFKKENWDWYLENFYHHLFASDTTAKNLISELGLGSRLFYVRPKTSIFYQGKISQFDSSLNLLTFPHLNFTEKIRAGAVTAYLKLTNNWQRLERVTAGRWLSHVYGQRPYQVLWQPLLQGKFGKEAEKISMAWFWARIKKRSSRLGYLKGGFQILVDKLVQKIKQNHGQISLNKEIAKITSDGGRLSLRSHDSRKGTLSPRDFTSSEVNGFDKIIITTPTSVFLKIVLNTSDGGRPNTSKAMTPPRWKKMEKLKMLGALNLILILKEKFLTDGTYWLNINEPGFPFVAVVEHTNFVDPKHYDGDHILYVGGYYPQNHPYFQMTTKQIFQEFLPYLKKINPKLDAKHYYLYTSLFAQPIIPINYSKIIPQMKTPVPNVFLVNMQMVYPWDRGINYAIEMGEKVADEILKD